MRCRTCLCAGALLLLAACTFDPPQGGADAGAEVDAAPERDADVPEVGPDAGSLDAHPDAALDAGLPDAAEDAGLDAGAPDLGAPDAGPVDAGPTNTCGDGRVEVGEACDDGNMDPADGCDACAITPGFVCALEPSVCFPAGEVEDVDGADPSCLDQPATEDGGERPRVWCTIGLAYTVDPPPNLVRVATATYAETLLFDDAPPTLIVAPAGATLRSGMGHALIVKGGSDLVLSGFEVVGAAGVKVENSGSRLTLLDNRLGPTDKKGVELKSGARLFMRRNVVIGNREGGLDLDSDEGFAVHDNVIVDNGDADSEYGAARIKKTHARARFVNNSLSRNRARNDRPAAVRCDVDATLVNVIAWGNTGQGGAEMDARCNPTYSILQASLPGAGNIVADPGFVDPLLHLTATSSAVDAGDPAGLEPVGPAKPDDFSRRARPRGAAVDIGAHEEG